MSKTETLHTCPTCQTSGFTARGLNAHVCNGKNRNPSAEATLVVAEVVDEAVASQAVVPKSAKLRILAEQFVAAHGAISLYLARGVAGSAIAGKIAAEIKKSLKHGEWLPFVKEHFEPHGIAERTIQYHMKVWEATKVKALKSAQFSELLDRPTSDLNEGERAELLKIASQVCQGTNADQLLIESGLKKEAKEKGGKREKVRELTAEEKEAALDELSQSTFKQLFVLLAQAREEQRDLLLRLPVQAANPEEEISLVHLRDALGPLLSLLDDAIATRTNLHLGKAA
jgi:hypothetical protein